MQRAQALGLLQRRFRLLQGSGRQLRTSKQAHVDSVVAPVEVPVPRWTSIAELRRARVDLNAVAIQVEYNGLWQALLTFPKRRPFAFAVGLNTVTCVGADLVVQCVEKKREKQDPKAMYQRMAVFSVFGFMQGIIGYHVYVNIFSKLCPRAIAFANSRLSQKLVDRAGQKDLVKQQILDCLVYVPFFYFPNFYIIKAFLEGNCSTDLVTTCRNGMSNYSRTFVEDNLKYMAVWIPANTVVFSVSAWLRLPLSIGVNFVWTCWLSVLRGQAMRPIADH